MNQDNRGQVINVEMQNRISDACIGKCSLASVLVNESTNPETDEPYSMEDLAKGYLHQNAIISGNDYLMLLEMIGYEKTKLFLENIHPKS